MSASDIYQQMYGNTVSGAETANSIPSGLLSALIGQESGWNPYAVGQNGEVGIAQLMPDTAQALGVDPWNTNENINGSAQYLSQQYSKFGNWRDALRAYNAGPSTAQSDPNAGAAYADKILSQFPNLSGQQQTQQTPQIAEAGLADGAVRLALNVFKRLLLNEAENALTAPPEQALSGSGSAARLGSWAWLTSIIPSATTPGSIISYTFGLLIVAALLWYGIKSLFPNATTIVLKNAGVSKA